MRALKIVVAVVVLLSVAVVCISPYVDLDPSALRAAQAALVLALAIAGNAFLLFCLMREQAGQRWLSPARGPGALLNLLCSRIC